MADDPASEDRDAGEGRGGSDEGNSGFFGRGGSGGSSGSGGSGSGGSGSGGSGDAGAGGPGDPGDPAALFGELNRMLGGSGGEGLQEMLGQLQQAFGQMQAGGAPGAGLGGLFGRGAPTEGGVNWTLAKDTARKASAQLGPDPTPSATQTEQIREAVAIVEVWLDDTTSFSRVGGEPLAWSRADWIESTQPVWQRLVEPVATSIADAMENSLTGPTEGPEAQALQGMEQMLKPFVRSSGASMFGVQLGQALARLAAEVVGSTDVGLPLHDRVALLPANVASFGEGLAQTDTDVRLYLAIRECARQRLFHGTSWLRHHLLSLVEEYARGITIDTTALENAIGDLNDITDLEQLNEQVSGQLFAPQRSPEQQAVLVRLETMLALVEGWVDEVVGQATSRWMPAAVPLAEQMRRQRATGGPAEATFASLVGLELRPRRLRDAANLWAALRDARGSSGRDAVWEHPDVIPQTADLDDPLGYVNGSPSQSAGTDTDFDSELAKLLDGGLGGATPEADDAAPEPAGDDAAPEQAGDAEDGTPSTDDEDGTDQR